MSSLLEGEERLEQELTGEPVFAPATGSVVLHVALGLAIVLYYVVGGFFHANVWGGSAAGGAIRVNIVSSALPLPSDQPQNQNVLATDKPSPAPEIPQEKVQSPTIDMKAIPIPGKNAKVKPQPTPKSQLKQPPPKQENRAQYGEQSGSSIQRAVTGQTTITGPVTVNEGDFGTRFAYYISNIQRKMASNWNKGEVDPRTPKGTRTFITFVIHKDGTVSNVQQDRSSGSPTLDRSCLRAAQRVDTFGPLPAQYSPSTVLTSYYCEY
jgi:periplasmic protein TonB